MIFDNLRIALSRFIILKYLNKQKNPLQIGNTISERVIFLKKGTILWSCRDSNPGPDKASESFLHVYH